MEAAAPEPVAAEQEEEPSLGDIEEVAIVLHICGFLSAKDLGRLACVSRGFREKMEWPSAVGGEAQEAARSIVEEAARLWLAGYSDQERRWVLCLELESWLGLMHEVALLRVPPVFGRAHGDVTLSEGGAVATKNVYCMLAGASCS